jgi:hypothetical protein
MPCRGFRPVTWPWAPPRESGGLLQLSGLPGKRRHPIGHRRYQGFDFFRRKGVDTGGDQHPTGRGSPGGDFHLQSPEWLYQLLWQLKPEDLQHYGNPASSATVPGIGRESGKMETRKRSLILPENLFVSPGFGRQLSGWKIVHLYDLEAASKLVSEPLSKIIRPSSSSCARCWGPLFFFFTAGQVWNSPDAEAWNGHFEKAKSDIARSTIIRRPCFIPSIKREC